MVFKVDRPNSSSCELYRSEVRLAAALIVIVVGFLFIGEMRSAFGRL